MSLRDPFAAYNAANNVEAHFVCALLQEAGIEAVAIDDVSAVGHWIGGFMPEIHKPQVWIEREDIAKAKAVLDDFEQRITSPQPNSSGAGPIEVMCEECGKQSTFPSEQNGSVQLCPHCKGYVDVGDEVNDGWDQELAEESEDEN